MILQGVGHPISCLGVCYANDPKKGGYTTPVPALDLTTSLRGDFFLVVTMVSINSALFPPPPPTVEGLYRPPPPPGNQNATSLSSPLPSWRPTCGQNGNTTCRLGGAQRLVCGENQKWLVALSPCGDTHVGKVATSPPPSWGSPSLTAGTKSEMPTSPLLSRGSICGQSDRIIPARIERKKTSFSKRLLELTVGWQHGH